MLRFFAGANLDQMTSATPLIPPMLFISMSRGYPGFGIGAHLSFQAMIKNFEPTIVLMLAGTTPQFLDAPLHHLGFALLTFLYG